MNPRAVPVVRKPADPSELLRNLVQKDHTMADTMYERLCEQIARFQDDLAGDEEVGASLTHFGKDVSA